MYDTIHDNMMMMMMMMIMLWLVIMIIIVMMIIYPVIELVQQSWGGNWRSHPNV